MLSLYVLIIWCSSFGDEVWVKCHSIFKWDLKNGKKKGSSNGIHHKIMVEFCSSQEINKCTLIRFRGEKSQRINVSSEHKVAF